MPNGNKAGITIAAIVAFAALASSAAASPPTPGSPGPSQLTHAPDAASKETPFLASRVPVHGVMAGMIDLSAFRIFRFATANQPLAEKDWLEIGMAAVNLVGAATLITVPDGRAEDADRLSDPAWLPAAREMQDASVAAGVAASNQDRDGLTRAASRLAQSCQSCHMQFSDRLKDNTR